MVQIKRDYNTVTQNNNHNNFTDELSTETQLSAISNDVKQRMVSLRLMMSKKSSDYVQSNSHIYYESIAGG